MEIWVDQADIAEILQDLGIDITSWVADSYAKLNKSILRAQRQFEMQTRRKYEVADLIEKLDGRAKPYILLTQYPINSISYIKVLSEMIDQEPVQVTNYRLENSTGRIYLTSIIPYSLSYLPESEMNVEISYNYGYASGTIPDDIQDAIKYMACLDVITRTPSSWEKKGLKGIKIGDYSETYAGGQTSGGIYSSQKDDWNDIIKKVITRYKRIPIR